LNHTVEVFAWPTRRGDQAAKFFIYLFFTVQVFASAARRGDEGAGLGPQVIMYFQFTFTMYAQPGLGPQVICVYARMCYVWTCVFVCVYIYIIHNNFINTRIL
jgi:hypothetical protein